MWYIDIERMEKLCFKSERENGSTMEITEGYEKTDTESGLLPVSKVIRELKAPGNTQNDTIRYDLYKSFLSVVLEKEFLVFGSAEDEAKHSFNFGIAFNTLVKYGILVEVK